MNAAQRKQNRLRGYYSRAGAYFVTVCTQDRRCTLCDIVGDGFPVPKAPGRIAEAYIKQIGGKYPGVAVDKYVVMPNHIHLLLRFTGGTGNPSPTLGAVLGWFKYSVTREVNRRTGTAGQRVFQRSYHDHVVRDEKDYLRIWEYIDGNPYKWADDCYYAVE